MPPTPEHTPEGSVVVYDPTQVAGRAWSNLPREKSESAYLMTEAIGGKTRQLMEAIGQVLDLYAVVAHPVEILDANSGELIKAVRMVLICGDTSLYSCVSATAHRAVANIMAFKGEGPWHPFLKVRVSQAKSRQGFNVYNLTLEPPDGVRKLPIDETPDKKGIKRG